MTVIEWRRVAWPDADLVFTTPAGNGIGALRLIRQAASDHGLALPDHAGLGTIDQIAGTPEKFGLCYARSKKRTFPTRSTPIAASRAVHFPALTRHSHLEPHTPAAAAPVSDNLACCDLIQRVSCDRRPSLETSAPTRTDLVSARRSEQTRTTGPSPRPAAFLRTGEVAAPVR
jgi:hypothetical protein